MSSHWSSSIAVAVLALAGAGLADPAFAATARASDPITIYAGPGAFYAPVGRLARNEVVKLSQCTPRGTWCLVTHNGPEGWVLASYLVGSAAKVEATPWRPIGGPSFLVPFPHHVPR